MQDPITSCFDNKPKINGVCICCSSQNGCLVNIMTCTHTTILENITKFKLDPEKMHICLNCHHILKKIEQFKQQVEDSIALLTNQGQVLKITKLHDLQLAKIVILDTTEPEMHDVEIKPIICTEIPVIKTEMDIEMKIEHESATDCDDDMPLIDNKISGETEEERYKGKITLMSLSEKDLEDEREKLRNSVGYLKLPFKCESCILGFDHEGTLARHMKSRHYKSDNGFTCNICNSVLVSNSSYKEHIRRHFRRHKCMVCLRLFHHLRSAIQHYDDTHAPPDASIQSMYKCKVCGFDTKSNRVYRHHMEKHKQRPECKLCGNAFVNASTLRVHMLNMHKQKARSYKCNECDKSYSAKSGLFTHKRSAHASGPVAYCELCNTLYKSEKALKHHIKTHSSHITENDKKFVCDECGMRFLQKYLLRVHIDWAHMNNDKYRCDICSKLFASSGLLKKHVAFVHEKKRPPKNKICDYCGRRFTSASILRGHIRTHTGERPLRCGACGASFAHSGALYTHTRLLHARAARPTHARADGQDHQ